MTAKRNNPEVDRLTALVASLQRDLADRRRDPGDLPVTGCGDSSCVVSAPKGMCTNGGCRCSARTMRHAMMWWRRVAAFREESIREMRAAELERARGEESERLGGEER